MNNLYDFYRGHAGRRSPQEFYANHWRGSKNQTQKQYDGLQISNGSNQSFLHHMRGEAPRNENTLS